MNAAFKKVFGEALEPLGFVKIKVAKLTYFVRVVNDEILHILTYRELRTRKTGYKSFEILGGVVSLYRRTIDFTKSPECWLKNNHHYYCSLNPEIDNDVMESAVQYVCDVLFIPYIRHVPLIVDRSLRPKIKSSDSSCTNTIKFNLNAASICISYCLVIR